MAMLGLAQGVISTFLILYINERLGYSLLAAGSFLSMLMIGAATGRSLWGVVSDRLFDGNRKPVLNIISVVAAVSITILAFWNSVWPDWLLMIVVIITGMSCIGWNGICLATVSEISDSDKTASSIGLASTLGWAGLFIGPIVFGSLTDNFGYFYAWSFVAVFCVLSLILSMYLPIKKSI
jgi:sugar phosphate permease